ncbi:MAG: translation initiation factor IF-2 [Microthrixaceae bacterium]|nr:translation initiation factor IF-2 [Microthrixaceae bacterium]
MDRSRARIVSRCRRAPRRSVRYPPGAGHPARRQTTQTLAPKLRVHELAKELGLTNKECLDLCLDLGIGVKTHSSSIIDAQADRVRRKAEREGLTRDQQPEEPPKPAKKAAAKKAAAKKPPEAQPEDAEPAPQPTAAPAPPVAEEQPEPPVEAPTESEAPAAPAAPVEEPTAPPAPMPGRVISSRGTDRPRPTRPAGEAAPEVPRRPAPSPGPTDVPRPAARAPMPPTGGPRPPQAAPISSTGRPIPPPPGPPLSRTGRPIPPPPGAGGRGPAPTRGARPGGPGAGAGAGAYRGPRPGGAPGGSAPGGRTFGGPPPPGGPPGGGPAGRGRPGGGPRPPRRKGRRRRSREELQPMDLPSYTPRDAAVPEGVVLIERGSTPQAVGPRLNRTAADVVRFLLQNGEMVTATQSLSDDMIELFADEIGAEIELVDPGQEQEVELQRVLEIPEDDEGDRDDLPFRPPVVTVMGHVDHGKTKLLDRIRNANVQAGEAGGITQHIGAYQAVKNGKPITFIDTPGHEAFTAMRARGAEATDIVILVVAADDGVMPQTLEAIQHARAAEVPIVVAVNKIDRENADVNRVLQQLAEHGLVPESWGGDTIVCEISALQEIGIDELLDNVLVVAELEDLRANPEGRSTGVVLEAHLDVGRGPVATILVQRGTLRVGDPIVAGPAWGRVRALIDDHGNQVKEAGPSTPVEVLGLDDVPNAGDMFVIAPDEKKARAVAETRERIHRDASRARDASVMSGGARLEDIFEQIQKGEQASLNLVVKADVQGSLEALTESLRKLERPEVKIGFVLRGVGGITESDIQLAATAGATLIGFNVRPGRNVRELAQDEGVEIRTYEVIYKLLEDIEAAMVGMLAPEFEEVVTGEAEVREIFRVPRVGAIAGCYVTNGQITRNSKVRFLREGTIIWKGEIQSLRRFKDDVREVASGFECGIGLSDFQDLKQGDVIETYDLREIPRS